VDNKIRHTHQEETYMNRKVIFNIISKIILLTVILCILITNNTRNFANEPKYIIVIEIISYIPEICNTLVLFPFVNLFFITKKMYSHLNNRLTPALMGQSVALYI